MSKQQGKANKLLDFLAGKGFYLVLILCVAAIGVSGYMLFFSGSEETPDSPSLALTSPGKFTPSPVQPSAPAIPSPTPVKPSPPSYAVQPSPPATTPQSGLVPDDSAADVLNPDDDSIQTAGKAPSVPDVSPAPEQPSPQETPTQNKQPDFFLPVTGSFLTHFSESADVFYEYMREWRYHPGIDIETNSGALVRAAADGKVKDILDNYERGMGSSIIIEHSGGFETVYSNLTGSTSLRVGQEVRAGDDIGAVGETTVSEKSLPPHLHFEILKDGEPVDPMDYLPDIP